MGTLVERVCKCGCGESFMARLRDVERGYGNYKNRSHASKGTKNPSWKGGRSSKPYFYKLRYMAKNPEKFKARQTLLRSVNAGILKRGCCEFCGDPKTQGHHEDYSKPLEVRWVCRKHHRLVDRWRREREKRLIQLREDSTKKCSVCGQEKPIKDFYKHPTTTDGHSG